MKENQQSISFFRSRLIQRMINLYGENSILTKQFVDMCKGYPNNPEHQLWNKCLLTFVEAHEADPQKIE